MSDTTGNAIMFIFLAIVALFGGFIGWAIGATWQQGDMLNSYCQSLDYTGYTKLDNLYYCYNSDGLESIDWMNESGE